MNAKTTTIVESLVEAMEQTDLDQLPFDPMGDSIRGVHWQLRYALAEARPKIEPKDPHQVPFHLELSADQAALYGKARQEAWKTCLSLFNSMQFLQVRGSISEYGVEVPASGSIGDAYDCVQSAKESLACLETMMEQIEPSGSVTKTA